MLRNLRIKISLASRAWEYEIKLMNFAGGVSLSFLAALAYHFSLLPPNAAETVALLELRDRKLSLYEGRAIVMDENPQKYWLASMFCKACGVSATNAQPLSSQNIALDPFSSISASFAYNSLSRIHGSSKFCKSCSSFSSILDPFRYHPIHCSSKFCNAFGVSATTSQPLCSSFSSILDPFRYHPIHCSSKAFGVTATTSHHPLCSSFSSILDPFRYHPIHCSSKFCKAFGVSASHPLCSSFSSILDPFRYHPIHCSSKCCKSFGVYATTSLPCFSPSNDQDPFSYQPLSPLSRIHCSLFVKSITKEGCGDAVVFYGTH